VSVTATSSLASRAVGRGRRAAAAVPAREAAVRRRRRPGLWAAGAALIAVGGLGAAALVGQAGDRVEVLAVARTVPVGQTIGEEDLRVARVAADPALRPVAVADRARVVGRLAAVELRPGALLTAAEVTDEAVPAAGQQVVGVAVRPGLMPARGVRPGDEVLLVPVPGDQTRAGEDSAAPAGEPVPARVVRAGPADVDGVSTVDVVVSEALGPRVAAVASTGRVALVLLPAGGR
jgi:hypothetical protein